MSNSPRWRAYVNGVSTLPNSITQKSTLTPVKVYSLEPPVNMLSFSEPAAKDGPLNESLVQCRFIDLASTLHTISCFKCRNIGRVTFNLVGDAQFMARGLVMMRVLHDLPGMPSNEDVAFVFRLWYCSRLTPAHAARLQAVCQIIADLGPKVSDWHRTPAGQTVRVSPDVYREARTYISDWALGNHPTDIPWIMPKEYAALFRDPDWRRVGVAAEADRILVEAGGDEAALAAVTRTIADSTLTLNMPPEPAFQLPIMTEDVPNPMFVTITAASVGVVDPATVPTRPFSFVGMSLDTDPALAILQQMTGTVKRWMVSYAIARKRHPGVVIHFGMDQWGPAPGIDAAVPQSPCFSFAELGEVPLPTLLPALNWMRATLRQTPGQGRGRLLVPLPRTNSPLLTAIGVSPMFHHSILGVRLLGVPDYSCPSMDSNPRLPATVRNSAITITVSAVAPSNVPLVISTPAVVDQIVALAEAACRIDHVARDPDSWRARHYSEPPPGHDMASIIVRAAVDAGRLTAPDIKFIVAMKARSEVLAFMFATAFRIACMPPVGVIVADTTPTQASSPEAQPLVAILHDIPADVAPAQAVETATGKAVVTDQLYQLPTGRMLVFLPIGPRTLRRMPRATLTIASREQTPVIKKSGWAIYSGQTNDYLMPVDGDGEAAVVGTMDWGAGAAQKVTVTAPVSPTVTAVTVTPRVGLVDQLTVSILSRGQSDGQLVIHIPFMVDASTVKANVNPKRHTAVIHVRRARHPTLVPALDYSDFTTSGPRVMEAACRPGAWLTRHGGSDAARRIVQLLGEDANAGTCIVGQFMLAPTRVGAVVVIHGLMVSSTGVPAVDMTLVTGTDSRRLEDAATSAVTALGSVTGQPRHYKVTPEEMSQILMLFLPVKRATARSPTPFVADGVDSCRFALPLVAQWSSLENVDAEDPDGAMFGFVKTVGPSTTFQDMLDRICQPK